MAARPQLFTRGLSGLAQSSSSNEISSPAEQRDDAKRNLFKSMRPLPTQHYWDVYFDRFVRGVLFFPFEDSRISASVLLTALPLDKPKTQRPVPAKANTPLSSKRLARRSSRSRTFGATTITHRSRTSRCASQYTSSSRASGPSGRTAATSTAAAGLSGCPRPLDLISGRGSSCWPLARSFRASLTRVSFHL